MLIPWQAKVAAGVFAIILAVVTVRAHDARLRDDGEQQVRDSLNAVMSARLWTQADSSSQVAKAQVDSARSVADSVQRSTATFRREVALIPSLPPIRVTPGDTVLMDDTLYAVPHPIASWMQMADRRITAQDSVLKLAAQIINVGIPQMRTQYDSAIAGLQVANTNLDSVATFERTLRIKAEKQRSTGPSKWQSALKWVEVGGAAYVGYRVGHR